MTDNHSRREMLHRSTAAVTGFVTLPTNSVNSSGVTPKRVESVDGPTVQSDLSLHNNGTRAHEVSVRIRRDEAERVATTETYGLKGLNAQSSPEVDETVFKTDVPSSADGIHVVTAALENGRSDSTELRLNNGFPDESTVVVRVAPNNTITADTIVE